MADHLSAVVRSTSEESQVYSNSQIPHKHALHPSRGATVRHRPMSESLSIKYASDDSVHIR
jgi:hypothetical protein